MIATTSSDPVTALAASAPAQAAAVIAQERADLAAWFAGIQAAEDARQAEIAAAAARATQRVTLPAPTPVQSPPSGTGWDAFAACVIRHESGGNPTAQNPSSSASGLFQDLDSTWGGYGGYSRAMYAPADVQYAMNYALWLRSGSSPWAGSGC